ncbi:MAG: hypothetical protein Q9192_006950 [Flavoplaca navasiana]
MPAKPALNELCLLCRQIFQGKWIERTLSPDKPTELGFGSSAIRSGYYGLRPYTDISFNPSTGLWQADDSLQQSNEGVDADLARSIHEFRSQSLESDPDLPDSSPRFFPGEEPDLLQRYKAAVNKGPIPTAEHLSGVQTIHTGRPGWVKRCQQGDDDEVSFIAPIHHTIQSLGRSSQDGCNLCTMLSDKLMNRDSREPKVDTFVYFVDGMFDRESAYVTEGGLDVFLREEDLILKKTDDRQLSLPPQKRPCPMQNVENGEINTEPHIGSPAQGPRILKDTLDCMDAWVKNCIQNHIQCTRHKTMRKTMQYTEKLPSRLLGVNPKQGNDFVTIQNTSDMDASTKGPDLPTRLLLGNLAEFGQGIQVANLPLTFQHAIDFARLLKCQYLWIDALCIIQDSQGDWLEESRTMSSIYSNSWLNLAATSSRDGSGGLYYPPNPALSNPLNVQYSDREYTVTDLSAWQRRIEDSPLNHRAWVQQERFLAPRVVHFSYDQIWWQCIEGRASETYPSGLPHYLISNDSDDLLLSSCPPYDADANVLHPRWLRWVEGYSKTDITRDSDRLVATAGIATSFMDLLIPQHSVYLAGIMSEHLGISLLWHGTGTPIKLGSSVAPSWSWASVKGGVKFDCGNLEITHPLLAPSPYTDSVREDGYPTAIPSEAEHSRTRPRIASDHFAMSVLQYYDPFPRGIIDPSRGSCIRMHAPLYRIRLTSPGHSQLDNRLQFQQIQVGAHESWPGLDKNYLNDESWYHDPGWSSRKTYFCRFLPKLYPPNETEAESDGHNDPDCLDRLTPTGLILEPTGKQRGEYQRIGWLSMHMGDTWSKLEEHEFLEDMADGTYVIDLV